METASLRSEAATEESFTGVAPIDTPEKVLEESVQLRVGCSLEGRPHEAGGGQTRCHAITVCRPEGALARLRDWDPGSHRACAPRVLAPYVKRRDKW